MYFILPLRLFVECAQHGDITLQADVAQLHHVRKLRKHGNANEHQRFFGESRLAHDAQLTHARRGNKLHAAFFINAHDLRQCGHCLHDAGDLDERIMAALYERCQILCQ